MRKKLLCYLWLILFFLCSATSVYPQIIVENASAVWEVDLDYIESPVILPRVITEYATSISHIGLVEPPPFPRPPRIIVEYATSITTIGFVEFPFCECDLNQDHTCNGLDWLAFYPDWGRSDCNDPGTEICECDLNGDGSCNGLDWLLFYPDWNREDCPIFP